MRLRAFESSWRSIFRMQVNSTIREGIVGGFESDLPPPSKKLALFTLVGLSVIFLTSVLFKPPTGNYFSICAFKNFTGLPCPGCGLTHSFCALAKGGVADAFSWNLMGPILFVFLVLLWMRSASVLLNGSSLPKSFDRITGRFKLVRAFAIAFGVYGIARIVYLLVFQPLSFYESPLSRLITNLIR